MEKPVRYVVFALLVFVLSALLISSLTLLFDNTCCNGLWKSLAFKAYLDNPNSEEWKAFFDNGANLVYVQSVSWIIQNFYAHFDLTLFQQMALSNALFAAIALFFFFQLIYLFTASFEISFLSTLFHCVCGLFLILSTNADDIMPAYSFYTAQAFFLVVYFKKGRIPWLFISILFFSLSWLMHWTMLVAPLIAYPIALWFFNKTVQTKLRDIGLFIFVILFVTMMASFFSGVSLLEILLPSKAESSAWVGFAPGKLLILLISLPRYLFGTPQIPNIRILAEQSAHLVAVILGMVILIKLAVEVFRYYKENMHAGFIKPAFVFFAGVFIIGSMMNAYEFGSDSQFLIQPMMWVPMGFAFYLANSKKKKRAARWIGFVMLFIVGLVSLVLRLAFMGADTNAIGEVRKIQQAVGGNENAFFITHGWDPFTGWAFALWGGPENFHHTTLSALMETQGNKSAAEIQDNLESAIEKNIQLGRIIVTDPFWESNQQRIVTELAGFGGSQKLDSVITFLKANYNAEVITPSIIGNFYRLTPKNSGEK